MAQLPEGSAVPDDGPLPAGFTAAERSFGAYVHVPFCRVRCGYCDFNTYTATELGPGVSQDRYPDQVCAEIADAARRLAAAGVSCPPLASVFFGGGTPTLVRPEALVRMLGALRDTFGLAPDAEVSVEANPDSIDAAGLVELAAGGVTRMSFGMQSTVPHVLATLERTHDPAKVPLVVEAARRAGLRVSLDLIYGTPGESLADWEATLRDAVRLEPDHVSAYALVVEPGTRMGTQVRRGLLPAPSPEDEAAKYELADAMLGDAGYRWYEVSNWARTAGDECRHNLAYWTSQHWWGFGPGAHSHLAGADGSALRWWNVKHPRAYAERIAAGRPAALAYELVEGDSVRLERVMLRTRLADGLPLAEVDPHARPRVAALIADGLVDGRAAVEGRIVPTLRGRLLADTIARSLT